MFMAEPPCPPELILRSAALRQGFSSNEVQVKRRRGEWVALRAGAYVAADVLKGMEPLSRHLALIAATMSRAPEEAALSHLSAACLWDIALWEPNLRAVQLTRPGSGSGHRRRSLQTFRTALPLEDVVTLAGYRVTGVARTVVDLAKHLPFEAAVVAADSALHSGITTVDALTSAADRQAHCPGIRGARRVIAFADGRSESVGESRTRVMIHRAALPRPKLQYEMRSREGILLGRADFGWEELRTLGEFDGREKYGRRLRPGQQPGDAVFQEKLCEDAMRDLGWNFVRLAWADLDHPADALARIKRALERDARSRGA
jgi:hypothetical protein